MMTVEEHLLVCLGEEGCEIAQAADKALRFGIEDINFLKPDGPNNRGRILDELNDLMGVVKLMVDLDILPEHWQNEHKQKQKIAKVIDCMNYAREKGALKWEKQKRAK